MLLDGERTLQDVAKIAVHDEIEAIILMLNGANELIHSDISAKLFPYLADNCLLPAFAFLSFPSWEFPIALEFPIAPLRRKYPIAIFDHGSAYTYCLHAPMIAERMITIYNHSAMRESRNYDLGNDGLWFLTLHLALPTALAQAVNVLYAIVDRMFIGHIAGYGDIALAGVGIAAPITTLISSFAVLIGMGGAPIMAMKEGHGEHESAEKILSTSFYLLLVFSAFLTPLFFMLRNPVLMAFGASEATIPYASEYLGWYVLGTPFALLASGLNSFVINQGESKKGMLSVLIGAALNIILDPIFIFTFGMGVKGAAIATVISQMVSAAIVISVLLSEKTQIKLRFRSFDRRRVARIMIFGLSPFIIIGTDSVLMIVLNSVLQRYGGPGRGDILITCSTIIQSYHLLVMNPLGGITAGCQGLVSFNYGAGNSERVKESIKRVQVIATSYTVIMFAATLIGSKLFASFFTPEPEIQHLASRYMIIFECMIIPLSFQYTNVDMMTALGQVRFSLPLSLERKIVFFLSTLILPALFQADTAFLAEPICDIISGILSSVIMWTQLPKILRKREAGGLAL